MAAWYSQRREIVSLPAAVYRPRNPQSSDYYRCVEDYFETFVQIYDEQFSRQYDFWRPYIEQVIYRYLDAACPVPDTGAIYTTALPVWNAKTAAMEKLGKTDSEDWNLSRRRPGK